MFNGPPDREFKGGYAAKSSGLVKGAGVKPAFIRPSIIKGYGRTGRLKHFPNVHVTDQHALKTVVPTFDPKLEFEYTERELMLLAEKMLLEDPKPYDQEPYYLPMSGYRRRQMREIQTGSGTPDPAICQGLYWRVHPNGRRWRTKEERMHNGAGFYA